MDTQDWVDEVAIGSLFTGTGALCELVVAPLLGGRVAWHCDNDPAAVRLLAHHRPDTPNLGDITTVDWATVEPVDVLAGGFPCPDISSAGRKVGIDGSRSGLWTYFVEAIRVLRPGLVLVENVADLVVRGLDRVLADLAALGFDAEWTVVRASDVGAPHRRGRVFVAAADAASQGGGRLEQEHVGVNRGAAVQSGQAEPGRCDRAASDTNGGRHDRRGNTHHGPEVVGDQTCRCDAKDDAARTVQWGQYKSAVRRWEHALLRVAPQPTVAGPRGGRQLNPLFVEWMMGWPEGHVTDLPGLSRTDMLRLLGNGVVPQQATAAFRHLLRLLLSSEGRAA